MAQIIPASWMPPANAKRMVLHWTAGTHTVSSVDRRHYHFIIDVHGAVFRGDLTIADNNSTSDKRYAAHTRSLNTGSIGISVCGMAGAKERPFSGGRWPITAKQMEALAKLVAQLSDHYSIPITRSTVLWHSEVQGRLGVKQAGKWDSTFWPALGVIGATKAGDKLRANALALALAVKETPPGNAAPAVRDREGFLPSIPVELTGFEIEGVLENCRSWIPLQVLVDRFGWKKLIAREGYCLIKTNQGLRSGPMIIERRIGYVQCNSVAEWLGVAATYDVAAKKVVIR